MQPSELDGYRIECPFTERLGIDPANTPTEGDNSMSSNLEDLSYTQLARRAEEAGGAAANVAVNDLAEIVAELCRRQDTTTEKAEDDSSPRRRSWWSWLLSSSRA